jgi:hypothetical protein
MRAPDVTLNYPNGGIALEIKGIEANPIEYITLGRGFMGIVVNKIGRLQPLINDFYQIYMKVKALEGR